MGEHIAGDYLEYGLTLVDGSHSETALPSCSLGCFAQQAD